MVKERENLHKTVRQLFDFTLSEHIAYPYMKALMLKRIIDEMPEELFESKIDEDEKRLFSDYLRVDLIATVMGQIELFATYCISYESGKHPLEVMKGYSTNDVRDFLNRIKKLSSEELAGYVAHPKLSQVKEGEKFVEKSIKNIQRAILKMREFYFKYLGIYNCYKHGVRTFPVLAFSGPKEEDKYTCIVFIEKEQKPNSVGIYKFGNECVADAIEISSTITQLIDVLNKNKKAMESEEGCAKFTLFSNGIN